MSCLCQKICLFWGFPLPGRAAGFKWELLAWLVGGRTPGRGEVSTCSRGFRYQPRIIQWYCSIRSHLQKNRNQFFAKYWQIFFGRVLRSLCKKYMYIIYNIIYIYNYIYILTKCKKSEIVSKNGRHRKSSTRNHVWISNCLGDQIVRQCWVSMGLLPMFDHITWLVVWNIFNCPYTGKNHPNWLIFFRGVQTTNQIAFWWFFVLQSCPDFFWLKLQVVARWHPSSMFVESIGFVAHPHVWSGSKSLINMLFFCILNSTIVSTSFVADDEIAGLKAASFQKTLGFSVASWKAWPKARFFSPGWDFDGFWWRFHGILVGLILMQFHGVC